MRIVKQMSGPHSIAQQARHKRRSSEMKFINRKSIVIGAASLAVMVGAGSALALGTPADNEAVLGDVATSLGVEQEALEEAVRDAQINRVDAAEADGSLSEERAAQLREQIETAETPNLGGPRGEHRGHHGHHGPRAALEPAAEALGVTTEELRELLPGTSLAAIAEDQGVAVEEVEAAIVTAAQERIDQALEDGKIDADRATQMTEGITDRVDDLVNRVVSENGERGFGKHGGFRGGPDGAPDSGDFPAQTPADPAAENEATAL